MFERYTQYHGSSSCNSVTASNVSYTRCVSAEDFYPNQSSYRYRRWQYHELVLFAGDSIVFHRKHWKHKKQ